MKLTELRTPALPVLERPPVYWREAILCTPAMPLVVLAGLAAGNIAYGAVAAGAAFSVGFGAARDLRGNRWAAMMFATVGGAAFAFIGSLAGQWPPVLLAVAAAAAAGCAAFALIDENIWWITLQMVIALLVAGYYPGSPAEALLRAAVVLAGGGAQLLIVMALARLAPQAARPLPAPAPKGALDRRLLIAHALRAAVCVALSLWLAQQFGLANSYWAPMTAMLVLKPGLSETHTRGVARLGGTVAGCVLASVFAIATGYSQPLLLIGMALTAYAGFALQKAHYAILSSAITATVVLLLELAHGGGVLLNAEHRLAATVLGGAIALIVARIAPHKPLAAHPGADAVGRPAVNSRG
jgi:hypothetical protein